MQADGKGFSACGPRGPADIGTGQSPVSIVDICLVSSADICPVSAADICPVSTADICPVSTEDIYPVSTEDITAAGRRPAAVTSSVGAAGFFAFPWGLFCVLDQVAEKPSLGRGKPPRVFSKVRGVF